MVLKNEANHHFMESLVKSACCFAVPFMLFLLKEIAHGTPKFTMWSAVLYFTLLCRDGNASFKCRLGLSFSVIALVQLQHANSIIATCTCAKLYMCWHNLLKISLHICWLFE